jgi:hypothetical protein
MPSIALDLVRTFPISLRGIQKNAEVFRSVQTYCTFLGAARSGKTLTASLLDAHPSILVADEVGALRYLCAGFSRAQIYNLLLRNSQTMAKAGRESKQYSFQVPHQWQGRFRKLRVIGDNHGQGSIIRLGARPWLVQRLRSTTGATIRFIHIVRNPYDNISAMVTEMRSRKLDLESGAELYFSLCETVADIRRRIASSELFELRYESLIGNPQTHLERLCLFLGVDAPPDYLKDCTSIVFEHPVENRYELQWSPRLVNSVKERMNQFAFLQGYSFG